MNRADETAAKIETAERQSAGAAAGSDDKLAKSHQPRPAEDLHTLLLRISHRLDYEHAERKTIDYRLRAIESQMKAVARQTKGRASRAFVRYLAAICVGVIRFASSTDSSRLGGSVKGLSSYVMASDLLQPLRSEHAAL